MRPNTASLGNSRGSGGGSLRSASSITRAVLSPMMLASPRGGSPGGSPAMSAFLGGSPFPPPNFMREKRNILEEQERLVASQQQLKTHHLEQPVLETEAGIGEVLEQHGGPEEHVQPLPAAPSVAVPLPGEGAPAPAANRTRLMSARPDKSGGRAGSPNSRGGKVGDSVSLPPLPVPSLAVRTP